VGDFDVDLCVNNSALNCSQLYMMGAGVLVLGLFKERQIIIWKGITCISGEHLITWRLKAVSFCLPCEDYSPMVGLYLSMLASVVCSSSLLQWRAAHMVRIWSKHQMGHPSLTWNYSKRCWLSVVFPVGLWIFYWLPWHKWHLALCRYNQKIPVTFTFCSC
jgi:hypothetical protein